MNPHILFVIDHQLNPEKYTQEQLDKNANAAKDAADAYHAAIIAHGAAYTATDAAYTTATTYWLNEYFTRSGENKQDYFNELEAQS